MMEKLRLAAVLAALAMVIATVPAPSSSTVTGPGGDPAERPDPCADGTPLQQYPVTALTVPVSYNNWGDLDPHGRLFVPDHLVDDILV